MTQYPSLFFSADRRPKKLTNLQLWSTRKYYFRAGADFSKGCLLHSLNLAPNDIRRDVLLTLGNLLSFGHPVAAGVMPKKNPCPEAKPAEVFRRSGPLSKRYGANISAGP